MAQDCIKTLRDLLQKQEDEFFSQKMESKILIQNLADIDSQIKSRASAYFKAAKEAEEYVGHYENFKYSADINLQQKQGIYDTMINCLKKTKEKETLYKEIIDNANSYLIEFRSKISALVSQIKTFEEERCEGIHSAINKFVVYEKFSEMNNKYDVNNFSKILDEYKTEDEMLTLQNHVLPDDENDLNKTYKFNFIAYESKKYDIAQIQKEQLTPPRERLQDYQNTHDLLGFILKKIFVEMKLHEEYLFAMGKIFKTQEGRVEFADQLGKRFQAGSKVLLGANSFTNVKESIDLLLYAVADDCEQESNLDLVISLMKLFEIFSLRNTTGDDTLRFKIKDNAIWKEDKIWTRIIQQGIQQIISDIEVYMNQMKEQVGDVPDKESELKSQVIQFLDKTLSFIITYNVPHQIVDQLYKQTFEQFSLDSFQTSTISQKLDHYRYKQKEIKKQAEIERQNKKSRQPQKGIPDWMKDLYDPLENLVTNRNSINNNTSRSVLSFKDLIKPSSRQSQNDENLSTKTSNSQQ